MAMDRRRPAVAGQFYPRDPTELRRAIEASFLSPRGPGRLPSSTDALGLPLRAILVPHAGYVYSGPIAAHAYLEVARASRPGEVLLLGVDHHGRGGAALSRVPWETPLGTVEPARELLDRLGVAPVGVDEGAHALEHSIEVQLPFLQTVLPHARIAALQVRFGSLRFLTEVGGVVARAIRDRNTLLVISTDFSHYVGDEQAREKDHLAIKEILHRDAGSLYRVVNAEQISMCGLAPATVFLAATREEPLTPSLLAWGHSGEAETMSNVVGYASMAFRPLTGSR